MKKETREDIAVPLVIFLINSGIAVDAKLSSYKVTGNYFDLKVHIFIPITLLIASTWSIVLIITGKLSKAGKTLSILLVLISIFLLAWTLYEEIHPAFVGR